MSTHSRIRLAPGSLTSLRLVLPALALGCSGQLLEDAPPGAVRGELISYVAARDDGTSDEYYTLRRGDEELRLLFDEDPDLGSGGAVDVWGTPEGDALRVRRFE